MGNYLELERLLTDDEKLFCAMEQDRSAPTVSPMISHYSLLLNLAPHQLSKGTEESIVKGGRGAYRL
jgi:hypothetical protein